MFTPFTAYVSFPEDSFLRSQSFIASTTSLLKKEFLDPIILLDMDVLAAAWTISSLIWSLETRRRFLMCFTASLMADLYPPITVVGWIFCLMSSLALFNNSAATITTEVVPSPTSLSCLSESSTSTLAAGCSTSNCFKIVAPSFVMVTSPIWSTNILSKPTGPNELFTMFATARQAVTVSGWS